MPEDQEPFRYGSDSQEEGIGVPRYTDTDLRALALEHAVQTRGPHDDSTGESTIKRANKFHDFLRGLVDESSIGGREN